MTKFKRNVLSSENQQKTVELLQSSLTTLIDLSLVLKQVHWNVVGPNFRSIHLQLDEILLTVRPATDEIAERIVTIGSAPDGRAATVAESSALDNVSEGFHQVTEAVSVVADALMKSVDQMRDAIEQLGDLDPVSEDLLIATSAAVEKHLWMVQAQEVGQA